MENNEEKQTETEDNKTNLEWRIMELERIVGNLRILVWVVIVALGFAAFKLYPLLDAWDKIQELLTASQSILK